MSSTVMTSGSSSGYFSFLGSSRKESRSVIVGDFTDYVIGFFGGSY